MKRLIDNLFDNMKIRTKLIFIYLVVVVVTVSIVGIYFTTRMSNIATENVKDIARADSNVMKQRVEKILKLAIDTSDIIFQDSTLHNIVIERYERYGDVVQAYNDYPILSNYLKYYDEISSIRLYIDNPTLLDNSNIIKVNDETRNSEWYQNAIKDRGAISWQYKQDEISKKYNLSLIRSVVSNVNGQIGVLVIGINQAKLNEIVVSKPYYSTILVDDVVVASSRFSTGIKVELGEDYKEKIDYGDDKQEFGIGSKYSILNKFNVDKVVNNEFNVLIDIPLNSVMQGSSDVIQNSIFLITVVIGLSLLVIIYFSRSFSNRVNLLTKEMERVIKGDFNINKSINGNDEISRLYDELYVMMESIKRLINEVYVRKLQEEQLLIKQKDAEFKMLASQINPHFLYNTLETIRMRCFCNGDRELANIVKKLGKIMRRNLEVSGENVTLSSEVELIRSYLEIQALRFGDKVEYEFIIEVDMEKYKILPLLLQPIVENAFVHGLEGTTEKGKITVSIFEDLGYLIVEISDNGCGISRERLEFINNNLGKANKSSDGHHSIGMGNINERIKIYYGEKYGIYVLSELNIGTKVIMVLPAIEGENKYVKSIDC